MRACVYMQGVRVHVIVSEIVYNCAYLDNNNVRSSDLSGITVHRHTNLEFLPLTLCYCFPIFETFKCVSVGRYYYVYVVKRFKLCFS